MKLIVTADWHIRQEAPRCRLDPEWLETQRSGIRAVSRHAARHKVPVIHTGDLFHHPRVATEAVNMVLEELRRGFEYGFYLMAGNHDLPFHSIENLPQSSIGTILHTYPTPEELNIQQRGQRFDWAHFGTDRHHEGEIRLIHRLIWPDAKARPAVIEDVGQTAEELLEEFPENKWILCGDYHHHFHFEKDGRHVVNPGCLNIQAADMIGYTPGCYLVDTDSGLVEFLPIPDEGSLVTDVYLKDAEIREDRMAALAVKLESGEKVSFDFDSMVDELAVHLSPAGERVLQEIRLEGQVK